MKPACDSTRGGKTAGLREPRRRGPSHEDRRPTAPGRARRGGRSSDSRTHPPRGGAPTGRRFPGWCPVLGVASMPTVVSAYRCGAVPDSHRVPSWSPLTDVGGLVDAAPTRWRSLDAGHRGCGEPAAVRKCDTPRPGRAGRVRFLHDQRTRAQICVCAKASLYTGGLRSYADLCTEEQGAGPILARDGGLGIRGQGRTRASNPYRSARFSGLRFLRSLVAVVPLGEVVHHIDVLQLTEDAQRTVGLVALEEHHVYPPRRRGLFDGGFGMPGDPPNCHESFGESVVGLIHQIGECV